MSGLLPGRMAFHSKIHPPKMAQFARRVFNIEDPCRESDFDAARKGIAAFEARCAKVVAPATLKELRVKKQNLATIAQRLPSNPEAHNLSVDDRRKILTSSFV